MCEFQPTSRGKGYAEVCGPEGLTLKDILVFKCQGKINGFARIYSSGSRSHGSSTWSEDLVAAIRHVVLACTQALLV